MSALQLVIQTAFLGDLMLTIPLLKELRTRYPQEKIGLVCRKGFGSFFKATGLVDEFFEIQKGKSDSYDKALEQLKQYEVRQVISPHESLRTLFFVRKIKAPSKIGFKTFWSFLAYNQRVLRNTNLPDAMRQVSLLAPLFADLSDKIEHYRQNESPYKKNDLGHLPKPPLWCSMDLRAQLLADEETFKKLASKNHLPGFAENRAVLLFPGSVWATKRWTSAGFISLGRSIQQKGYQVYVMGGPGEEELAQEVAEQIPGAICFAGKTSIYESAQLIARAELLIGNDSASCHIAAVCETPHIAIFGPTVLEFGYRPWGGQSYVIDLQDLKCRPCGKHGHHKCPINTHECMVNISPARVLKTVESILR